MRRLVLFAVLTLLFVGATSLHAQTATFTWNGSTDSSQLVELALINGQPVNQATGYAGAIQVVNGDFLMLLELPQSLGFPNGGYLDCASLLTFGAKQWGTRPNATAMDGTQAGDYYYLPSSTTCPVENGANTANISISFNEFREFIQYRYCGHGRCRTVLVDTMESGSGTARVN